MDVYLRPLAINDSKISFRWRNDPEIWLYTGNSPDKVIDEFTEKEWIANVINRDDQIRFAICIRSNDEYVGNIQLTNISEFCAELHIFIGEKKYWNKGIGNKAIKIFLEYIFCHTALETLYLQVDKRNLPAIRVYEKNGFVVDADVGANLKMICKKSFMIREV